MAFRNDYDINKQQITSTPVTSTTVSTATTTSTKNSTPIPVGKSVEKNEDPVTKYINSEEFLAKTQEQQLEELQKKFPNIDVKQLSATLNAVKSTIENDKNNVDTEETVTNEPEELSDGEKALAACEQELRQKVKKDVTIDDVISNIKRTPEAKRTPEQIKALEYYENVQKEVKSEKMQQLMGVINKYGDVWDSSISKEVLQSSEWKALTPQAKMAKRIDAVLAKTVEGYASKSEKEKTILRESFYNEVGKLALKPNENWETLSAENKEIRLSMISIAADAAESSEKTIKEVVAAFKKNPQEVFDSLADYAIKSVIENFDKEKLISPDFAKKKSGIEKLKDFISAAAKKLYPEYQNLSEENQKKIEASIIDNIGKAKYKDNWDKFTETQKLAKYQELSIELSALCYSGENIEYSDYKKLPISEQLKYLEDYEKAAGIRTPEVETIRRAVMKKHNRSEVTDAQVKAFLEAIPSNKRTKKQNLELQRILMAEKNYGQDSSKTIRKSYHESMEYTVKNIYGGDFKLFVEKECLKEGESLDKLSKERKLEILREHGERSFDMNGIMQLCTALGIPPYEQAKILKGKGRLIIDSHSTCVVNGDGKGAASIECTLHKLGVTIIEATKPISITKLIDNYTSCNNENVQALTEHNAELIRGVPELAPQAAKSTNIHCLPDMAGQVHMGVACAKGMPDAGLAAYSQSAIQTAHSDQDRYRFMQAMSRSDSSAVMEGLAAASKSVKDPGLRRQYDSYVDNAILNYPPEQQSRIRQARETGEISSYTLSQTTVQGETSSRAKSENRVSEDSSVNQNSRTQASETPVSTAQAPVPTAKSTAQAPTAGVTSPMNASRPASAVTPLAGMDSPTATSASAKTSATNTPQSVSKADNAGFSSTVSQQISDKELEVLTQKAEAVLEKIENFIETQAESIEQRQIAKLSETTSENVTAQMSEEDIIEAITSSEIDVAQLEKLNLSEDEKESLRKSVAVIFENNSVSAAYTKFVSKFGEGARLKFLEVFAAKGDAASIRSFANDHKNDAKIISILYQYSQDSSLIAYLPKDEVFTLLLKGKITDLSKINPDILADFIQERMKSEKNPRNLLGYLKLLPLEYQGAVLNQYPDLAEEVHGSDKWLAKNSSQNSKTKPTETTVVQEAKPQQKKAKTAFVLDENLLTIDDDFPSFDDGLAMGSTTVPNPRGKNDRYDKRKIKGHIYMKG